MLQPEQRVIRMGDTSGGRDMRDWEAHSVVYSPSSLSPIRSEEFDHQQSSITLLKAQLKLVTQERDMLKTDLKRISKERDGAIRHLSLSASPQSSLETSSHHRTNSDTAPSISKAGGAINPANNSTLKFSHEF